MNPVGHFTKSKEELHIFAQIATYRANFCVPSLFCPWKVANFFDALWEQSMFFAQGHGRNCHYISNEISGMVQGNIAFKQCHFLTLGDKFYHGPFA